MSGDTKFILKLLAIVCVIIIFVMGVMLLFNPAPLKPKLFVLLGVLLGGTLATIGYPITERALYGSRIKKTPTEEK